MDQARPSVNNQLSKKCHRKEKAVPFEGNKINENAVQNGTSQ